MQIQGLEREMTALLTGMNLIGNYPLSLVCTDQGLLVAASGESLRSEIAAGLTSLFDDIVVRAQRDLGFPRVDELTLTDGDSNRYVIRPLPIDANLRLFLVVQVPVKATWRHNTNLLIKRLIDLLRPLVERDAGEAATERQDEL
ncbi:MAG: hypothetical protein RIT28_4690 [Pseudomonadota bacterium]|jgi:hypothetical protein